MSSTQLVVVGGGPGGYAAAFYAADLGLSVALVDTEPNPGGVCVYRGCIPSKALLHAARVIEDAAEMGARAARIESDPEVVPSGQEQQRARRCRDGCDDTSRIHARAPPRRLRISSIRPFRDRKSTRLNSSH